MKKSDQNETETLRNNIEVTRGRMDETIDALGSRLQPRHLLDELLGFFRRHEDGAREKLTNVRESVSHSTESAMHSVIDTIKKNPLPALLIGAGAAWFIYSSRKSSYDYDEYDYETGVRYDPDVHIDRPLDYPATAGIAGTPASWDESSGSKLGHLKDSASAKASQAGEAARRKMGDLRRSAGEKADHLRHAASEKMGEARERAGEIKGRVKRRVSNTADHHPLEVGLACLATGLIAGLLIPTPRAVDRAVGDTADRLRERTRQAGEEMLSRGKRVASAAVTAAKDEAESQGITPEHLRESASAVAKRARDAGSEAAHEEGLTDDKSEKRDLSSSPAGGLNSPGGSTNPSNPNAPSSDPSVARPAV